MLATPDSSRSLRWSIYGILIAIGIGNIVGRILAVNSVDRISIEKELRDIQKRENWQRQRPFLSANDRSRWLTIRALVERGTYAIDDVIEWPNWDTIDMVRHVGPDGKLHFYSSKPPLLVTILAGEYWVIEKITGWTLQDHTYEIGRFMVITWHVPLLLVYFILLAKIAERYVTTDWARIFIVAAGVFATFLTTFAVVLSNHLPAAVSAMVTLYCTLRILFDGERSWRYFALAGLCGAFTVVNELPSLSAFALLTAVLLWGMTRPTLSYFVPGAAVVVAAFFGTNYIAHGTWRPAYDYRHDAGKDVFAAQFEGVTAELDAARLPDALRAEFGKHEQGLSEHVEVLVREPGTWWWIKDDDREKAYSIERRDDGLHARLWDSWYHFVYEVNRDGEKAKQLSYWFTPSSLDRGEASPATYALHVLIGHHGIFSLTPIWILTLIGLIKAPTPGWRKLSVAIAAVTIICLAFYIFLRPMEDRNYGGSTSGFRWAFWFSPLWLIAMLPALDAAAKARWSRIACLALLGFSVLSVAYPTWNPWTQPWLMNFFVYLGWVKL